MTAPTAAIDRRALRKNPTWTKLQQGEDWTAERIKALRSMVGIGREDLAAEIGSTERTIYRWENDLVKTKIVRTGGIALARFASARLTPAQIIQLTEVGS